MFVGILIAIFVIVCIFLVLVILLQSGKGEGLGVTFGGSSQTVFGARGAADFLSRTTTYLAIGYLILALLLAKFYQRSEPEKPIVPKETTQTQDKPASTTPAKPAGTPSTPTQTTPAGSGSTSKSPATKK